MPPNSRRTPAATPPGKKGGSSLPTPATVARDAPDSSFTWKQAFPFPGVVVVMGDRGSGKTATAYWIMEQWRKDSGERTAGAVYKAPRKLAKDLPDWVSAPQLIANLPRDAICIIDEAQLHANARRSQSAENLDIGNLVSLSRQRNQLIILLSPSTA